MGKRGPVKTPTVKLQNRGSWRSKTRPEEPVYDTISVNLEPPKFLGELGLKIWHNTLPVLVGQGVITQVDVCAFSRYCKYWERWQELVDDVMASQADVARYEGMLVKLEKEFGLTPASRPSIKSGLRDDNSHSKQNYFKVC